jgi:hypothetical protein
MTALDVLTHDAGARVRKGRMREYGGVLVLHLFRLLKLAQMHSLENQAFRTQLDEAAAAFREYRLKAADSVAYFFAKGVVFFSGEPLKASRSVYESALELGAMMKRCGGSELSFAPDVGAEDLRSFVVAVTRTLREPMTKFSDFDVPRVRLREVSAAAQLRGLEVEQLDEEQRVVRTYASAVVVMRRFFEALMAGEAEMPRRIKRIAQALVDLSAGNTPALLGVTAVRNANHDEAGRAVNTAILAVAMARRLTQERAVLTCVAMAALLLDAGRPRALRALRGEDDSAALPTMLPDSSERGLPAGTAAVLTSLGRLNEPTILRSVVIYEALWARRIPLLGALYRGLRTPTLHARIVAVARAYNDLLTPQPAEPPRSPSEALLRLEEEISASKDRADMTALRLLMATVGLLPPGTLVQLSSGASAVVLAGESAARLRLRVLLEADGALPEAPREVAVGEEGTEIVRIVGSDPRAARQEAPPVSVRSPALMRAPAPAAASEAPPISVRPVASMRPPVIAVQPPDPEPVAPMSLRGSALPAVSPAVPDADEGRTVAMASNVAQAMIAATTQGRGTKAVPEPEAPRRAPSSVPPGKQADFSGDLQKSPLPHVLLNVLSRRLSGSLVLDHEGQEHSLVFEAGVVSKVRSAAPAPRLGDLLRERLGDERVEACARKALERKVLLGKQLVIDGLMPAREVMQALAEQQAMRVVALCDLPRSTLYGFFNQHDLLPGQVALESSPLALVLRCMRAWNDQTRMEESLQKLGERPLALHTHANLDLFGFSREESAYLDWIFLQRLSYAAIRRASPKPFDGVRLLLYTLAIARHLDLGPSQWPLGVPRLTEESVVSSMVSLTTGSVNTLAPPSITPAPSSVSSVSKVSPASSVTPSSPPSSRQPLSGAAPPSVRIPCNPIISDVPPAPPPSTPSTLAPAPAVIERNSTPPPSQDEWTERRRQIAERAADLSGKNHYEVLQIAPDATEAEVQKAFLDAVRIFHPDRLPAALEDLRAESFRVFGAIVEAHKTLTNPAARASYDAALQTPGGGNSAAEQAEVERVLGASRAFQKAQILLRRNDVDQAERLAQEAVSLDPQPDHLALRGWIHALRNQLPEAIELLNRSIEESPQAEEALFYRGTVLKRMGHEHKAISDFRRVLEQNPKHLEAAREVRLFEMRRQGAQAEDEGKPGLFGKLFQKKKS